MKEVQINFLTMQQLHSSWHQHTGLLLHAYIWRWWLLGAMHDKMAEKDSADWHAVRQKLPDP